MVSHIRNELNAMRRKQTQDRVQLHETNYALGRLVKDMTIVQQTCLDIHMRTKAMSEELETVTKILSKDVSVQMADVQQNLTKK